GPFPGPADPALQELPVDLSRAAPAAPLHDAAFGADRAQERLAGPADPGLEVQDGAAPPPGGADRLPEEDGPEPEAPHGRVDPDPHVGVVAVLGHVGVGGGGPGHDLARGPALAHDPAAADLEGQG